MLEILIVAGPAGAPSGTTLGVLHFSLNYTQGVKRFGVGNVGKAMWGKEIHWWEKRRLRHGQSVPLNEPVSRPSASRVEV